MSSVNRSIFAMLILASLLLIYLIQFGKPRTTEHSPPIEDTQVIPSIVHFIVGQTDDKQVQHGFQSSTPFTFINYLIFLAARRQLRPEQFIVHYYEEPKTFWWNITKNDPEIDLMLVPTRLVNSIFDQPVAYHTHRSDILRLEILLEYGGIYLDIDVLALRPFQPLLNLGEVVVAHEDHSSQLIGSAVILARKNAGFLRRVYDSYQNYNRTCYRCNAVEIPAQLAAIYPREVTVLPSRNFFEPGWGALDQFFDSNHYNFSANYATHLWNSFSHDRLSALTADMLSQSNFTLARMFQQAIGRTSINSLRKFFPVKRST